MARPDDAAFLQDRLGRRDLAESDVDAMRTVLVRSGALASCREEAARLLSQAVSALEGSRERRSHLARDRRVRRAAHVVSTDSLMRRQGLFCAGGVVGTG